MASESNRVEHNVGETDFRQFSKQLYTTWLEVPVSGTLDIVTLSYNKYGLNIHKLSKNLRRVKLHSDFVYKIQLMLTLDVFTMKQVKI